MGIFTLLGWPLKPLPTFNSELCPLGARFDLSRAAEGTIIVGNKPDRAEEMHKAIMNVIDTSEVSGKMLEKIRGRILFQRSLCYGRFGGVALRQLTIACTAAASASSRTVPLHLLPDLRAALHALAHAISSTPARLIRVALHLPIILFTDGSYEVDEGMRVGGVLFDRIHGKMEYFGARLSAEAEQTLLQSSKNPITAVELAAALLAVLLWQSVLSGQAFIAFVDNDAAKHAVVRGYSSVADVAVLAAHIADAEINHQTLGYWERVASPSNLADPPSRGSVPPSIPGWPAPVAIDCRAAAVLLPRGHAHRVMCKTRGRAADSSATAHSIATLICTGLRGPLV